MRLLRLLENLGNGGCRLAVRKTRVAINWRGGSPALEAEIY